MPKFLGADATTVLFDLCMPVNFNYYSTTNVIIDTTTITNNYQGLLMTTNLSSVVCIQNSFMVLPPSSLVPNTQTYSPATAERNPCQLIAFDYYRAALLFISATTSTTFP